jgi:hypothetical protein
MLSRLSGKLAVAVALVGSIFGTQAQACDPYCTYKRVVVYVQKEVPYQDCITKYDCYGNPQHVYVTRYRTVEVPVTKLVKVCH